jgi:hypothetical protein
MKAFLWNHKLYLLHMAAGLLVFLDPSVRAFAASHSSYSFLVSTAWGWALHWANGRLGAPWAS